MVFSKRKTVEPVGEQSEIHSAKKVKKDDDKAKHQYKPRWVGKTKQSVDRARGGVLENALWIGCQGDKRHNGGNPDSFDKGEDNAHKNEPAEDPPVPQGEAVEKLP